MRLLTEKQTVRNKMGMLGTSIFRFKSVQYGAAAVGLIGVISPFLQTIVDTGTLQEPYLTLVKGALVLCAVIVGKKQYQPELHQDNVLSFAKLEEDAISFDEAFERLIGHEGGYSIDKNDPGNWTGGQVNKGTLKGTKYGLAANTYPNLDIKNLTLAQAKEIYRTDWWDKLGADGIHSAIVFQLWDFAINAGKERVIKELQQAIGFVGSQVDGKLGPATKAKVNEFDINDVILTLMAERLKFYTELPTFSRYGKGWVVRCAENLKYAAKDN